MGQSKNMLIEINEYQENGLTHELNLFLEPKKDIEKYPIENKCILNLKKGELLELASKVVEDVNDGLIDGVDVLIMAKKLELFFDALKAGVKGNVQLPQSNDYKKHGAVLNEQIMGVRYDYSVCGHEEYNQLSANITPAKDRMKKIEDMIKKAVDGLIIDKETGEEIKVNKPLKTGTNTIVVKILE